MPKRNRLGVVSAGDPPRGMPRRIECIDIRETGKLPVKSHFHRRRLEMQEGSLKPAFEVGEPAFLPLGSYLPSSLVSDISVRSLIQAARLSEIMLKRPNFCAEQQSP